MQSQKLTFTQEIINCTICRNTKILPQKELLKTLSKCITEALTNQHDQKVVDVESNLTEDWILNQLVHYFRIYQESHLLKIATNLVSRYKKEFVDNDRSVLALCLVGDENIAQSMVLWISDIEQVDKNTWVIRLSDYYYFVNILLKPQESEDDEYLVAQLNQGVYKVGMKLHCQNIQQARVPLENGSEYSNPVVNTQNKETFKVSIN